MSRPGGIDRVTFNYGQAAPPVITGTTGTWIDVTPGDMDPAAGGDCFGCNATILVHPQRQRELYTFCDLQGMWKSTNFGLTWLKQSAPGSVIEGSKSWGSAIAPDGSYMLVAGVFRKVCRSNDGGYTWFIAADGLSWDAYGFDIDPADKNHVIATAHDQNDGHLYESSDGGYTWTDRGAMGAMAHGSYAYFGQTASTIIAVAEDGDGTDTLRGTWNGSAWSWNSESGQQHYHGSHQLFVDRANNIIFNPGLSGIEKSTDDGQNWSSVTAQAAGAIARGRTTLYAMRGLASQGTFAPQLQHATAPDGSSWTDDTDPAGMDNGPKWMVGVTDGITHAIVAICWNYGIWRYVEP